MQSKDTIGFVFQAQLIYLKHFGGRIITVILFYYSERYRKFRKQQVSVTI